MRRLETHTVHVFMTGYFSSAEYLRGNPGSQRQLSHIFTGSFWIFYWGWKACDCLGYSKPNLQYDEHWAIGEPKWWKIFTLRCEWNCFGRPIWNRLFFQSVCRIPTRINFGVCAIVVFTGNSSCLINFYIFVSQIFINSWPKIKIKNANAIHKIVYVFLFQLLRVTNRYLFSPN